MSKKNMSKERNPEIRPQRTETIIDGSTDPEVIKRAVVEYTNALQVLAFPPDLSKCEFAVPENISELQPFFVDRIEQATEGVKKIILQINTRAEVEKSPEYAKLVQRDKLLWGGNGEDAPLFGVMSCVDRGIPYEAMVGIDGAMGRTLGGDSNIHYSRIRDTFFVDRSALHKRMIHFGRTGNHLVEPFVEHTGCGRRGQILANEMGGSDVPGIGFVFEHISALAKNMPGNLDDNRDKLQLVQDVWNSYKVDGKGKATPDNGMYAGIVHKMAQRVAYYNDKYSRLVIPIEIYDKHNGDLIVGTDNIAVLTDETVLQDKGFTHEALESLIGKKKLFSFTTYAPEINKILSNIDSCPEFGSRTYEALQQDDLWLQVQTELVIVTEHLWNLSAEDSPEGETVREMISDYLNKALSHLDGVGEVTEIEGKRLVHHMLHAYAYTYLLDTLNRGNVPGHHVESHLATGDHDSGTRRDLTLGQGDLSRPNASEIYTGYTVLMHSEVLKEKPIILMIKLDTDREGEKQVSFEEATVGIQDLSEAMKLWPYILVGDIVPIIVIRGKQHGGVSRVGLSIALALNDMVDMLEVEGQYKLPRFVPANTSNGEVVLVSAREILEAGIEAKDDIPLFRKLVNKIADKHRWDDYQETFQHGS